MLTLKNLRANCGKWNINGIPLQPCISPLFTVGLTPKDSGEIDTLEKDLDDRLDSEEKHITQSR